MWTESGMPGYCGRVKLVKAEAPTAEFNPPGFSASWAGSSEAESPTESATSGGAAEFSPCRHDEVRTARCTCAEVCWTEDAYAWERCRTKRFMVRRKVGTLDVERWGEGWIC